MEIRVVWIDARLSTNNLLRLDVGHIKKSKVLMGNNKIQYSSPLLTPSPANSQLEGSTFDI